MRSLAGQLLLASRRLTDPNFRQTIILMVQHNKDGALGLVLNRPMEVTIREACEEGLEINCRADGVLHQGGPCEGPLMAVHAHADAAVHFGAEDRCEVFDGLYFSTDQDELEWLLRQENPKALFFLGYSGWSPGQLENELANGGWVVAPATAGIVFNAVQSGQWGRLVSQASLGGSVRPELIPDDPSVN
jgi:putative transcriptional regulator